MSKRRLPARRNAQEVIYASATTGDRVRDYLIEKLRIEDISRYDLRYRYEKLFKERGIDPNHLSAADMTRITEEFFSDYSAPFIAKAMSGFTRSYCPHVWITADPGSGKSHLIPQIALLLAMNIRPSFLDDALGLSDPDSLLHEDARLFLGNSNIIYVDKSLLSIAERRSGPDNDTVTRQQATLAGLFAAAAEEWKRTDDGKKHGRRTVFIFEEAANFDISIFESLKPLLSETSYDVRINKALKNPDRGYHAMMISTTDEYTRVIAGDGAMERRFSKVHLPEMPESRMQPLLRKIADDIAQDRRSIHVEDLALQHIIKMRNFLNWPPMKAPASIEGGLNDLVQWKILNPGKDRFTITRRDTQAFMAEKFGLGEVWVEGPNGEPPLHDLAVRLKKRVFGQDHVIDPIVEILQRWYAFGIGKYVPVLIIPGPTGSGKDTFFRALNEELYGRYSSQLVHNLSNLRGFGVNALFTGPNLGNHSDGRPGRLQQGLESVEGNGLVVLNEAGEFDSWDELKVLIESGVLKPEGVDSRERPLRGPIIIAGQWGENQLKGKSIAEQRRLVTSLTTNQIKAILMAGTQLSDGRVAGKMPAALVDRIIQRGGLFFFAPTDDFASIAKTMYRTKINAFAADGIRLEIDDLLAELVDKIVVRENDSSNALNSEVNRQLGITEESSGARMVGGIFEKLTDGVLLRLRERSGNALPSEVRVSVDPLTDDVLVLDMAGTILLRTPVRSLLRGYKFCGDYFSAG